MAEVRHGRRVIYRVERNYRRQLRTSREAVVILMRAGSLTLTCTALAIQLEDRKGNGAYCNLIAAVRSSYHDRKTLG